MTENKEFKGLMPHIQTEGRTVNSIEEAFKNKSMPTENRLSDKQKEVLTLMRDGRFLYKNVTYVILAGCENLRITTFYSLKNKGLIEIGKKRDINGFWVCKLTKQGKTIKL